MKKKKNEVYINNYFEFFGKIKEKELTEEEKVVLASLELDFTELLNEKSKNCIVEELTLGYEQDSIIYLLALEG